MSVTIPNKNDKFVTALIEKIGVNSVPILLTVIPEENSKILDCFPIVQDKVKKNGGKMILGWQFLKSTNLIEAEFHAVWESPDKELIDITPKSITGIFQTLFLIDENLIYEEKQKDNFRINITQNKLVDDFIEVCQAIFKFENKGERAFQYEFKLNKLDGAKYQKLKYLKEIYQTMLNMNFGKNKPCLCRSGKKFKHCHGKDLQKTLLKFI